MRVDDEAEDGDMPWQSPSVPEEPSTPPLRRPEDNRRHKDEPFQLTKIGDLLREPEEANNWLVNNLITYGSVVLIAAKPKVGKSTTARDLALSVAHGGTFLDYQCRKGAVWYLALEGRRRDVRAHFQQMGATENDLLRVFVGQAPKSIIVDVRTLAARERPAMIVIDTMQRFLRAQSTDDYAEMTTLFDNVIAIARQSGATIVLLHHSSKADRASLDTVLGSTAIAGSADTIILLARTERYRTISTVQRTGDDLDETIILLDEATGRVCFGGSRHLADVRHVKEAFREVLGPAGMLTRPELLEAVEARRGLKLEALRELVAEGTITRVGKGTKKDPYLFTAGLNADDGSQVPPKSGNLNSIPLLFGEIPNVSTGNGGSQSSRGSAGSRREWEPS